MTIDEKIEIIKAYQKLRVNMPYGYGTYEDEILKTCELLKAFGWEWGHKTCYPDFRIRKGYYITNNSTGHKSNPDEWYVEWDNGNVGAYQFVGGDGYNIVQNEFREFKEMLMSYNPVNYDKLNCHIVYDIENGKKVLADYEQICKETRKKMEVKIKKARLEKAKADYEKLLADIDSAKNEGGI